jgi:hypothetical protein
MVWFKCEKTADLTQYIGWGSGPLYGVGRRFPIGAQDSIPPYKVTGEWDNGRLL